MESYESLAASGLTRIQPTPIINGRVPPPSTPSMGRALVGTIPSEFQLDADFAENQYGGQVPSYRLMPPAFSGESAVNSTVVSGTTKIAETANQASQTASTANSTANTAATGVTTINSTPVIQNVGGVLISKQIDGLGLPILQTQDNLANGLSNFTRTSGHSSYFPTSNPLTATDAGSNATISIGAFTMQVGGTAVSNNSGSITALSYSTLYYVYYSDPTLAGGAITYLATTTKSTAVAGNGQLFVGSILTPTATAPNTSGNGDGGTGAQYGAMYQMLFNTATPTVSGGTVTNPSNAIDGSFTSFATIAPAATGGSSASLLVSGMPGIRTGRTQTITLNVLSSVTSASGPITLEIQYSLNGGASFSTLYSVATDRTLTIDSVTLTISQNPGLVQIKASIISTGTAAGNLNLYESWISIQE